MNTVNITTVCIYVLGGKDELTEPLRQVVYSSNTNSVKFLSCHKQRQWFSSEQTTQYFTNGSDLF